MSRDLEKQTWILIASVLLVTALLPQPASGYGQPESTSGPIWSSDHYFPKFPVVHALSVLDLRSSNSSLALTLLSLQGIVNRQEPRIYLILDKYSQFWLDYAKSNVNIQVTQDESPSDLIVRYRTSIRGIVVYDPSVPDTINLAATIAGLDDRLIADPASLPYLQQLLGHADVLDLRENVRSLGWDNTPTGRVSIYRWMFDNLWPKCDQRMIAVANPGPPISRYSIMLGVRDYIVALRLATIYLSTNDPDQKALYERFLSTSPSPIPVFGWTENEEGGTVSLAAKYGDWVAVLTHIYQPTYPSDLTVLSGIDVKPIRYQPKIDENRILQTVVQPGVYLTAYVTDGDNLGYDYSLGWDHWNGYQSSRSSLGWTIDPALIDVAPLVWNYYMTTAGPAVTFVAGPSAAGYTMPIDMTSGQLAKYVQYAKNYWSATGLRTGQVIGWSDQGAVTYSEQLTPLGVFTGYHASLQQGMIPFSLGANSETFFHFTHGSPMPIAPNAYSIGTEAGDWDENGLINNLLNTLAGKPPSSSITYAASHMSGSGDDVSDPSSVSGTVRVGYANSGSSASYLVFGPYVTLPSGSYQVSYRLKMSNQKKPGPIASIDVASDLGETILAKKQVFTTDLKSDSWQVITLNVELQKATNNIEFRIRFFPDIGDLHADTINVVKTDGWKSIAKEQPIFLAIGIIAYSNDAKEILSFLQQLSSTDPSIHLLNTDEFFAAINPSYMQHLLSRVLARADSKLVPADTLAHVRDADHLLATNQFGEYLTLSRTVIKQITATLKVEAQPPLAGSLTPNQGSHMYPLGETVIVTQNQTEGYKFAGWILDGKSLGANVTLAIKMDSDHNLTATYEAISRTSTISSRTETSVAALSTSFESRLFLPLLIAAPIVVGVVIISLRRKRQATKQ